MDSKNITIILLCAIIVLLCLVIAAFMFLPQNSEPIPHNETQANANINQSNETPADTTVEHISYDEVSNDYSDNSQKTHTEHLNGGDVEVDSNGMVVGSYNPDGEYFPGGQMSGMSIEDARSMDEYVSVHGMA